MAWTCGGTRDIAAATTSGATGPTTTRRPHGETASPLTGVEGNSCDRARGGESPAALAHGAGVAVRHARHHDRARAGARHSRRDVQRGTGELPAARHTMG